MTQKTRALLEAENNELRRGIIPDGYVFLCIHCAKELKLFEGTEDGMEVSATKPSELE